MLLVRDATVTVCHSKTVNLDPAVGQADIVVAAVGRPELVSGDWVKPGELGQAWREVVIDAGYNEGNVGDVAFDEAVKVAGLITPFPVASAP
jgi:methylenetetrahydrofolate dehydrogenase (NADP+)/methenyltetrahydrofolate cyclohydrolase